MSTTHSSEIAPLAVFARFKDSNHRVSDVGLSARQLHVLSHRSGGPVERLVKAADEVLRNQFSKVEIPVAYVGIGWGRRALAFEKSALRRGDFVESEHPRVPKGNPEGGDFAPKNEASLATSEAIPAEPEATLLRPSDPKAKLTSNLGEAVEKRVLRRGAKTFLRTLLRIPGAAAADIIPAVGEAYDIEQTIEAVRDIKLLHAEITVARDYAKAGAQEVDALRVSQIDEGFSSSNAFAKDSAANDWMEKRFGAAGDGYQYHHIVEQGGANETAFTAEQLHSTENMIRVPTILHEEISAAYSAKSETDTTKTVREALRGKSFEEQRAEGIKIMRKLGIIK